MLSDVDPAEEWPDDAADDVGSMVVADDDAGSGVAADDDSGSGVAADEAHNVLSYPDVVAGIHFNKQEHDDAVQTYQRLRVQCPHHDACQKNRNTGAHQTRVLGFWEPIAYLACWIENGSKWADRAAARDHIRRGTPSIAQQRAWLEAHADEINELREAL